MNNDCYCAACEDWRAQQVPVSPPLTLTQEQRIREIIREERPLFPYREPVPFYIEPPVWAKPYPVYSLPTWDTVGGSVRWASTGLNQTLNNGDGITVDIDDPRSSSS